MSSQLFHTDLGFPVKFQAPTGTYKLEWSNHANKARYDDRYGFIETFDTITTKDYTVIELLVEDGKIAKIVLRGELDNDFDITYVLIPRKGSWLVKTVWLNYWNDTHKTLDTSKYDRP